uniref:Uncharacterized protein LOC101306460 n=1 Tax=Rhizophora mucronata TaxID=61149 RepID=A0A2P2QS58_RHIMU
MEQDQVRPLASAAENPSSDGGEAAQQLQNIRRRRFIKCCGCTTSLFLILAIVVVILILTVFRIRDPIIKMNGVTITRADLINGTIPRPGSNITILADVSVKNPNEVSFRYTNTTTTLLYHGVLVGEARGPPGKAKARRTMRMNVTLDIITDRLISNPSLTADFGSGLLTITSNSRVPGTVKFLHIIRKNIVVRMNCSLSVSLSSREIQSQRCRRKVEL